MLMKLTVLTGFKVNMHCYRLITFLEMGKAVVLLLLLENLPDFNDIINTTLQTLGPELNGVSCNPIIIAPVLEVIGEKLGLEDSVERLLNVESQYSNKLISNTFQELSPEALYNIGTMFDNSKEDSMSLEKSENVIEQNNVDGIINQDVSECEILSTDLFKLNGTQNSSNISFPESAPFLAAIFETVSNVTAQTCAGVLLSTHWVLTAASCINVLGPLYSNSSFTGHHYYTIVIGATNPLKDGTVHNVSKIILHPTPTVLKPMDISNPAHDKRPVSNSKLRPIVNVKTPSLALIRIAPDAESVLRIMENRTDWDGINARVYGWSLVQNQSGHDSMMATSVPAEMLIPAKCKTNSVLEDNSTFCLSMNDTTGNVTRMTSGGPVVVIQDGRLQLLGVALSDGSAPLLASTVAVHRDWLHKTIGT